MYHFIDKKTILEGASDMNKIIHQTLSLLQWHSNIFRLKRVIPESQLGRLKVKRKEAITVFYEEEKTWYVLISDVKCCYYKDCRNWKQNPRLANLFGFT